MQLLEECPPHPVPTRPPPTNRPIHTVLSFFLPTWHIPAVVVVVPFSQYFFGSVHCEPGGATEAITHTCQQSSK